MKVGASMEILYGGSALDGGPSRTMEKVGGGTDIDCAARIHGESIAGLAQ